MLFDLVDVVRPQLRHTRALYQVGRNICKWRRPHVQSVSLSVVLVQGFLSLAHSFVSFCLGMGSDGKDVSPPLQWRGIPAGTHSLALIVDDPDAPDPAAPRMTWVHWLLYNIPVTAHALPEAVSNAHLPSGTLQVCFVEDHAEDPG